MEIKDRSQTKADQETLPTGTPTTTAHAATVGEMSVNDPDLPQADSSQAAAAMKVGDTVAAIGSMVHVVAYNGVITEQRLLGWTLNNESPVVASMASASAQNVTNVFVSAEAAKAYARNLISQQINSLTAQLLRVV